MGACGQGRRGQDHSRGPEVLPHLRPKRFPCAASFRHGHRLPGRHDEVHHREGTLFQGVRSRIHQRLLHRFRRLLLQGRPVLRIRSENQDLRQEKLDVRQGRKRHRQKRQDAAAPALRLPDAQGALRPLRHRQGVGRHRRVQGQPAQGVGRRGRHGQAQQGRHHDVRPGLDPAFGRRAKHPVRRHHPAAFGQRRRGRRRHQRPARRTQRPGLHRPLPALRRPARLPSGADHGLEHPGRLPQGQHAGVQGPQERQLVAKPAQIRGQPAQGLVWRRRHGRKRVRLRLAAAHRTQCRICEPFHVRQDVQGQDQGRVHLWPQPGHVHAQHPQDQKGPDQS